MAVSRSIATCSSRTWRRSCCRTRSDVHTRSEGRRADRDQGRQRQQSRSTRARSSGSSAIYKGGEKTKLVIRAMNKMHRLLRKRKSITFTDKTDQQILTQVVGDAGLYARVEAREDDHVQARLPAQPDGPRVPPHARGAPGLPRVVRRHEAVRQAARPAELGPIAELKRRPEATRSLRTVHAAAELVGESSTR